ncbi:MAG: hypothetical protein U5K38_15855 [Woeseiaceae bacterium]|nr:hypothetical protein [Woeseiaceae bacterium]
MPVLTSGFVHASTRKVLALQGVGRGHLQCLSADEFGRLDKAALKRALEDLDGKPAVVYTDQARWRLMPGEFDPVSDMIDLARQA